MEGVTILNIIEITMATWGWSWIGFFVALAGLAIVITPIAIDKEDACFIAVGALFGSFALFMSITIFATATELPPITQYQVTIDDTVSLKEFNEKYIVIEQEGLIYTVQEKEVINND